jgi:hypothetical protein
VDSDVEASLSQFTKTVGADSKALGARKVHVEAAREAFEDWKRAGPLHRYLGDSHGAIMFAPGRESAICQEDQSTICGSRTESFERHSRELEEEAACRK